MLFKFIFLALFLASCYCQSLPNPARCVAGSGITAFPACQYMYGEFSTCSAYAAESKPYSYYNCYCQQKYFNAIYDCNSEQRLCLGNPAVDVNFEGPLSVWHSECDSIINYSPTTPVLSPITASYETANCVTAQLNCASLTSARTQCTESYTPGAEAALTSCLCQPPVLSLAYSCSVLGNVSCIQVPAALTGMAEYGRCSNLGAVLTIPASVTASLGTGTTIRFTYSHSIATAPSAPSTLPPAPAPASTVSSGSSAATSRPASGNAAAARTNAFSCSSRVLWALLLVIPFAL